MKRRHDRKGVRREEGLVRQERWSKLTPAEQLSELDKRLGDGVGAVRQRTRLKGIIEASKKAKKAKAKAKKAETTKRAKKN